MSRNRLRPKMSEREAAGRLMRIPGIVEAEATMPNQSVGVPKLVAKGLSTGLLLMVELRIANKPIAQIVRKIAFLEYGLSEPVTTITSYENSHSYRPSILPLLFNVN